MDAEPIIIVEVNDPEDSDVAFELRRRGFLVQSEEMVGEKKVFAVSMAKRLVVKLSLHEEIPLKPIKKYSAYQSLLLANAAIAVILRASSIRASAAWVAHDESHSTALTTTYGNEAELTSLCNYFGPHVSLQFGIISFNRYHLTSVSVIGLVLFLQRAAFGDFPAAWMYVFCIYLALWGSYHLQRWKQRQNSLLFMWGVLGADADALDAEWSKVSRIDDIVSRNEWCHLHYQSHFCNSSLIFVPTVNSSFSRLFCDAAFFLHCVQADDSADELQQWHAAFRAVAGMWIVVAALLLLLAAYVTIAPWMRWLLPARLWFLPSLLYAAVVPVLAPRVLRPACYWLNSLEKHSTKVWVCSAACRYYMYG